MLSIIMKIKLLSLLLLFFGFSAFAQHDYQLLVGLNMNDCIPCVAGQLDRIDQLNKPEKDVDITLVIGENYAVDSSLLIKRYNLHGISKRIIWSNKLLKAITNGGSSAVLFSSKYRTLTYRFNLKLMPAYLTYYIDRADRPLDSLFTAYPNLTLGGRGTGNLQLSVNEDKVYFINALLGGVNGYDLLSGKKIFHFDMPDSIVKLTFPYSGLPASQCDIQHKLLMRAHYAPYDINWLAFDKDTLYLEFDNPYLIPIKGRADSGVMNDNVCVLKMVDGKVDQLYRYRYCFTNTLDNRRDYCVSSISCHYYDKALYNFIYSFDGSSLSRKPYYVMGRFQPDKEDRFQLTALNKTKDPPIYLANPLACENICYDKGYFSFPLIDTLYSLTGKEPNIPLKGVLGDSATNIVTNPCTGGIAIRSFKVTDSLVWLVLQKQNGDATLGTVVKYNRYTEKIVRSKIRLHDMWSMQFGFDPIDPDFLLYTSTTNSRLYRRKMF